MPVELDSFTRTWHSSTILTFTDNLALGAEYTSRLWLSDRKERLSTQKMLVDYDIHLDGRKTLAELTAADRTMIAIVRALHHGTVDGLIVLDEPTASFSAKDSALLFRLVRRVRDRGATVLWVTHRLHEAFEFADRVSVLRDGQMIGTTRVSDLNPDALAELIIGRPLGAVAQPAATHVTERGGGVALDARGITGAVLRDVSIQLRCSEILGVSGLAGSAVDELLHLLYGSRSRLAGEICTGNQVQ
jgi:ribose transport system ATP-binding protein